MPDDNRSDRRGDRPGHPDPVVLLDYHEGKLSADEADRVQEHLVHCPECSQVILDFADFPRLEPRTEAHRLTPAEVERQRRDLEARIERESRPAWQRHEVLLPLAATFLVAAAGLAVWGARLQVRIAELDGPRGDVYIVGQVAPEGALVRGSDVRRVPPWAGGVQFYLPLSPAEPEYPAYEVDVVSGSGRRVVTGLGVERTPEGGFGLQLPRGRLPDGRYRFELYGIRDGTRTGLETYSVAVAEARE